jgi:osmotically-inducible protein OsmY
VITEQEGTTMSADGSLQEKVRTALESHPHVTAKDVAVSCRAGAVTLRGTVPDFRERRAAVDAVRAVPGVDSVYDLLKVRLLPGDPRDDELRAAALQALIGDGRIPAEQIEVDVEAAWATIKGEVARQQESDAAFEDVAGISGLGGITNAIRVVTAPRP